MNLKGTIIEAAILTCIAASIKCVVWLGWSNESVYDYIICLRKQNLNKLSEQDTLTMAGNAKQLGVTLTKIHSQLKNIQNNC